MKTKYITLAAVLLFSLSVHAQAQSDEGGIWDGIEGTLSNMFDNAIQGTEAGRLFKLFTSDISMIMKAHEDEKNIPLFAYDTYNIWFLTNTSSDASMYAEFDWDNKALSMHLKESEENAFITKPGGGKLVIGTNKAIDHYQFTDKDGYWYVPGDTLNYAGTGEQNYIKFNAKKAAQVGLGLLSELNLGIIANDIDSELREIWDMIGNEMWQHIDNGGDYFDSGYGVLLHFNIAQGGENAESRINEIRQMLNEEYLSMVGFPVFIHWALIYSPNVIRANYNVTETTQDCYNIPNGCTKLTVASGKERGKYMIFDQYNRLIYMDSKKEGSVQFNYDRDLTVRLPPASKLNDIINSQLRRN